MNKTKQVISVGIALFFITTTTLKSDQVIAAPACRDVPSCGVAGIIIGTQIISGVLYYIVKNAEGVVHKVRAKQSTPPSHRTAEPGRHRVGDKVRLTGSRVSHPGECERLAREYGHDTDGGRWVVESVEKIGTLGAPGRIGINGEIMEEEVYYICEIKKVQ
ncbi:MAG: hypothetical protein DSM106950_40935 [Stigonema ocellatum SAG 48.90 = DSM 106950]|nr:hypothetical protein [Stigonema ocellatum SAG 48.90 = DSM 106950]